ncbi:MAG: hypothetical protein K6F50_01315 [Kiritimatiellae bacterium]|nr:hypothetical protein [Kiritimatiellia bacterium]
MKTAVCFVACFAAFCSSAIEPVFDKRGKTGRREVEWFSHKGDPAWGDPRTDYTDRFSIVKPVGGDRIGAPLLVVLHWRGGGWPGKGVDMQTEHSDDKDAVFSAPDDFYILNLDDIRDYHVLWNRTHDQYWWGATPNYRGPEPADVPRLLKGETPCEKRVMDTVMWTIRHLSSDTNRVYLCGNSMGGQAAQAIGLSRGDVFAAVNANVPATVWFAAARLGFVGEDAKDAESWDPHRFPDPPVSIEWSGVDDVWSRDREVVVRNMAKRKWQHIVLWGDYGHCGSISEAREKNDLVGSFDWLSIRRDEAYAAFTNATCDDKLPWPFSVWQPSRDWFSGWDGDISSAKMKIAEGAKTSGQINAFFRWRTVCDRQGLFGMELWIASPEELGTRRILPPESAVADVTPRRMQTFSTAAAEKFRWTFGGHSGVVERGADGVVTIPALEISREKKTLFLAPVDVSGAF